MKIYKYTIFGVYVVLIALLNGCSLFLNDDAPLRSAMSMPKPAPLAVTDSDNRVFFAYDQSTLTPKAKKKLKSIAHYLTTHPKQKITLTGHIDTIERSEKGLGRTRVQAVEQYFLAEKIAKDRIVTVDASYSEPLRLGCTEALKDAPTCALNRRVLLTYS
jgi:outer membrane protein OmpA-like peptidoglycan-associated protein